MSMLFQVKHLQTGDTHLFTTLDKAEKSIVLTHSNCIEQLTFTLNYAKCGIDEYLITEKIIHNNVEHL